uniref:Uncharacterized protein n=1 Tax=viral metagenome TaxID=1070528 RepID=A0A6C0J968_9ZZZZ
MNENIDIFDSIQNCMMAYNKPNPIEYYNKFFLNIKNIISTFKKNNPNKNFNREIRGSFDYTPLHKAVLTNQPEIVKLLIEENADPTITILHNINRQDGIMALYLCEEFGKPIISNLLRPYTNKYIILFNNFYNIILHKKNENTNNIYSQVTPTIFNIILLSNRLSYNNLYLPNELWYKILECFQLKDLV